MSRVAVGPSGSVPALLPVQNESKRDRKRRETINKIERLHEESWNARDEKFNQLWKDLNTENRSVNAQPPRSQQYLLRLYPHTIERDALLEASEIEFQYKAAQAKKMYDSERENVEAQYWDARDQIRQRLLGLIEERRRKLREEKDGGDIVTETLLEAQPRARAKRRMPFRGRGRTQTGSSGSSSAAHSTGTSPPPPHPASLPETTLATPDGTRSTDLLLHQMLAPALAHISTDDIIYPSSSSLQLVPPANGVAYPVAQPGKRGPRGKQQQPDAAADKADVGAAPGTLTALAIASGQIQPEGGAKPRGRGAGAATQTQWVLGKSLSDLKKMESANLIEVESDWARIQGVGGRGRRRGVQGQQGQGD